MIAIYQNSISNPTFVDAWSKQETAFSWIITQLLYIRLERNKLPNAVSFAVERNDFTSACSIDRVVRFIFPSRDAYIMAAIVHTENHLLKKSETIDISSADNFYVKLDIDVECWVVDMVRK